MKKFIVLTIVMACTMSSIAQAFFGEKPKLVVGIVVDQMRWDYLDRYYSQFGNDGFRRLINEGYSCNNCLINYVPTVTAIGHTSIYTGTTPALHGICGNTFYIDGQKTSCTQDNSVESVGSNTNRGKQSPHILQATTIGDQLRLHTDFKSKVIGVSYKDRAAILPAGHGANAAYWLDTQAKPICFVTSTYYMQELPQWAKDFNKQLAKNKEAQKHGADIGLSPLCGTITTDMAIETMQNEQLGKGEATDMLCVSYSQTDVIGHKWGTRGTNTDEVYLQLDKDIARLLNALDAQVGKGNYLVFLTADHGAAHSWQFSQDHKLHSGPIREEQLKKALEESVAKTFDKELKPVINGIMDNRLYLNHKSIEEQGLDLQKVKQVLISHLLASPNINFAVDYLQTNTASLPSVLRENILRGYHPRRSGDIIFVSDPSYYLHGSWLAPTGTTHGAWNPYDSHIPLLFMGWKVPHGATSREVHITDIAPTVCQLLHIQQPNACIGEAITEITK